MWTTAEDALPDARNNYGPATLVSGYPQSVCASPTRLRVPGRLRPEQHLGYGRSHRNIDARVQGTQL